MDRHLLNTIDPVVIGERLAAARRARRLTQQDVADVLDVARTTVVAIEKGERRPRATELIKLATLFGRATSEFLRPDVASDRIDFVAQFRESQKGQAKTDEARQADIEQFERLCRWYLELEVLNGAPLARRYPEPYDISDTPPERAAQDVATAERNRLGLGDGPIGDLWDLLETDVGLRVFAMPMRDRRIAGMFVYSESLGGCIAVNANHSEERRRWSGGHEFGHFLTMRHRAEVTLLVATKRPKEHERFADAFARHFLMPAAGLARRFDAIRRAKETPFTPGDLLQLASLYDVSAQAMTWRLEELRLLPVGTWDRLTELGFQPNQARRLLGLSVSETGTAYLPTRYQTLAIQAYLGGKLTEGQLAERLLTDRVNVRELVHQMTTVEQPDEDGLWTQATLDLSQPIMTKA